MANANVQARRRIKNYGIPEEYEKQVTESQQKGKALVYQKAIKQCNAAGPDFQT
jgi:hypothetical protein